MTIDIDGTINAFLAALLQQRTSIADPQVLTIALHVPHYGHGGKPAKVFLLKV
jgi:hypothetical protein